MLQNFEKNRENKCFLWIDIFSQENIIRYFEGKKESYLLNKCLFVKWKDVCLFHEKSWHLQENSERTDTSNKIINIQTFDMLATGNTLLCGRIVEHDKYITMCVVLRLQNYQKTMKKCFLVTASRECVMNTWMYSHCHKERWYGSTERVGTSTMDDNEGDISLDPTNHYTKNMFSRLKILNNILIL